MSYKRKYAWMVVFGISSIAWGQGGRAGRAAAQQQSGAPANPGRGDAPAGGTASGGALEFFNYDTSAGVGIAVPDGQPIETHQKITVNGDALAYTARAGYMPLRNATTGQAEAHLFYTCYAKDGVSDA